jgi:hypothetical protein
MGWWSRGRALGVVLVVCLAVVAAGTVATMGFERDIRGAVSYRDLVDVMVRWQDVLTLWSRVTWAAVVVAGLVVAIWVIAGGGGPRRVGALSAVLVGGWVVHTGLSWYSTAERSGGGPGELAVVPGGTPIGEPVRQATLASGPLFPAYGWIGLVIVVALGVMVVVSLRRDRVG